MENWVTTVNINWMIETGLGYIKESKNTLERKRKQNKMEKLHLRAKNYTTNILVN